MIIRIVRIGITALIAALLVLPVASAKEEKVSLDKVPPPVMDAVKARFGDAAVKGAGKEKERGKLVYEVTLEEKGRNVDVTLTPAGEMLLIEKTITQTELPGPVRQALEHTYPGASYRTVEEIVEVHHGRERLTSYEVLLATADGHKREVRVSPDGKALPVEEEEEKDSEEAAD